MRDFDKRRDEPGGEDEVGISDEVTVDLDIRAAG
jgi:hypothetical protein